MAPPKKKRKMSSTEKQKLAKERGKKAHRNKERVLEVGKNFHCQQSGEKRSKNGAVRQDCSSQVLGRRNTPLKRR